MTAKVVHFGAGNIGRGFVGAILHGAGYELVFADVNEAILDQLNQEDSYTVHEVGEESKQVEVTNFRAVHSGSASPELIAELVDADLITTAVGPNVLKFIAPVIAEGLRARSAAGAPKAVVIACENAINATDRLKASVLEAYPEAESAADFANAAVDRIVPNQPEGAGLDVTVEPYFEWVVEASALSAPHPEIAGVTWAEDLAPYITRKLFTVNTGHASTAYFGYQAGKEKIGEALADQAVYSQVSDVLGETSNLLVNKFGFEPEVQRAYVEKILHRFQNPELPDTVVRVGREPIRKISRNERFIGPAAELAERGLETTALVSAVQAALRFNPESDAEAQKLAAALEAAKGNEDATANLVTELTGIEPDHPLYPSLLDAFKAA